LVNLIKGLDMKRLNIVIIFTFIVSLPISGVGRDIIDYEIIYGLKDWNIL